MAWVSDPTRLQGKTVLVTGGHGFIGRHVVAALARAGAVPRSTVHPDGSLVPDLPGENLSVDLEDADQANEVVKGADIVVHLAARAGGIQFQGGEDASTFSSNRRITDNVLAACARANVDRVFLASSSVIYQPSVEPIAESWPVLGPVDQPDPYTWSKVTDEVVAELA